MTIQLRSTMREMSVAFPPKYFGPNRVPAEKYYKDTVELVKKKYNVKESNPKFDELFNREFDKKKYDGLTQPFYDNMEFTDWSFTLEDSPTPECPWTIEMVRETMAYKQGRILEPSQEEREIVRKSTGEVSAIPPENFKADYVTCLGEFEFIQKTIKFETQEEGHEYKKGLNEIIEKYRIVNVPMPEYRDDIKKYAKELNASRVLIEMALDEVFNNQAA